MANTIVGVPWRAAGRQAKVVAPGWLQAAKAFKGTPTAVIISGLAKNIQTGLKINVLLAGEPVGRINEGLVARLGTISRKDAYQALLEIAEGGVQKQEIALSLEDTVVLMKKKISFDLELLSQIHQTKETCRGLSLIGAPVVVDGNVSLHVLSAVRIVTIMDDLRENLGSKSLSAVLSEWVREGWEVLYGKETREYTLGEIVEALV